MKRALQWLLLVATALAAAAAAQAPGRDAARSPSHQRDSRSGTVTNPTVDGATVDGTGAPAARAAEPETAHTDTALRHQAQDRRRQALEQCQTVTGASRTDCVRRADDEFKRATSDDTHADRALDPSPG